MPRIVAESTPGQCGEPLKNLYQVFVSSTYEDLKEERQRVIQSLLMFEVFPAAMEFFNAASEDTWSSIKRIVDRCDYYILILGGMYGSVDEKSGKSYTELEYDYAVEQDKPTIAFYRKNLLELPGFKLEQDPAKKVALERFIAKVKAKRCREYTSPDQLGLVFGPALHALMDDYPSKGWIRAEEAADPAKELALREQIDELRSELKSLRNQPPPSTEHLAQGGDAHSFKVSYVTGFTRGDRSQELEVTVTWDELFSVIGTYLVNPPQHQNIQRYLATTVVRSKHYSGASGCSNRRSCVQHHHAPPSTPPPCHSRTTDDTVEADTVRALLPCFNYRYQTTDGLEVDGAS